MYLDKDVSIHDTVSLVALLYFFNASTCIRSDDVNKSCCPKLRPLPIWNLNAAESVVGSESGRSPMLRYRICLKKSAKCKQQHVGWPLLWCHVCHLLWSLWNSSLRIIRSLVTESHAGEAATHDHMMSPIKARRGEVIVGLSVHDAHGRLKRQLWLHSFGVRALRSAGTETPHISIWYHMWLFDLWT